MTAACPVKEPAICAIAVALIRRDRRTQHRSGVNAETVRQYAALMRDGLSFPPIRVWWDGTDFWLSDGFQRLAACDLAGIGEINCEVRNGSFNDALWDSFAANATHGTRRTPSETQHVIQLALSHENSALLSNVEIARHLHIAESTVRRWRNSLTALEAEAKVRLVKRRGSTYSMTIRNLGHGSKPRRAKSRSALKLELVEMKRDALPTVRRVLSVIEHWILGQAAPADVLEAMRKIVSDDRGTVAPERRVQDQ